MDDVSFDVFARRTARMMTRKTSFKVLAATAATAAAATPFLATAKNAGKKAAKKCKRQKGQCLDFVQNVQCRAVEAVAAATPFDCVEFFSPCCEAFGRCQALAGFECLSRRPISEK